MAELEKKVTQGQFVIAHMSTLSLYKDDKSLRFTSRNEAKSFVKE